MLGIAGRTEIQLPAQEDTGHGWRSGSLPMVEVEQTAEPSPAGDLDESTAIGPTAVIVNRGPGGRMLV